MADEQLGQNLQQMFPQLGWEQSYDFEGSGPAGHGPGHAGWQDSAISTSSRTCSEAPTNPGALAEVDIDRVRDLLGDDAAKSSSGWPSSPRCSRTPASIENKEGRLELTPRGLRTHRPTGAARPVHEAGQGHDRPARAPASRPGPRARLRHQAVRVRRPVQPRTSSARSATPSAAPAAAPRSSSPRRLRDRAHRAPYGRRRC